MTATEILRIRLYNQLLSGNGMKEPHQIVSHMGAMQSQAFDMARWAIGARLEGSTDRMIEEAINEAKIIRTHVLRPTWHFVAAEDVHWMLELSLPRQWPVYTSYAKMLGIDPDVFPRIWPSVERALRDHNHLTRQELTDRLVAEGFPVDVHLVQCALSFGELEGLICNGKITGKKQTFCLLQERVPKRPHYSKEESLEKLARKYFTSHAPATIHDFSWWSGLPASEAKKAFELIKDDFISENINGKVFRMKSHVEVPAHSAHSALLLPQFDEMVVSYKDRAEMITDEHYGKVMTKNGLFSPTIMLNGEIIGSWRKAQKKGKPEVELTFFEKTAKKTEDLFKKAEKAYLYYLTGEEI